MTFEEMQELLNQESKDMKVVCNNLSKAINDLTDSLKTFGENIKNGNLDVGC